MNNEERSDHKVRRHPGVISAASARSTVSGAWAMTLSSAVAMRSGWRRCCSQSRTHPSVVILGHRAEDPVGAKAGWSCAKCGLMFQVAIRRANPLVPALSGSSARWPRMTSLSGESFGDNSTLFGEFGAARPAKQGEGVAGAGRRVKILVAVGCGKAPSPSRASPDPPFRASHGSRPPSAPPRSAGARKKIQRPSSTPGVGPAAFGSSHPASRSHRFTGSMRSALWAETLSPPS